MAEDPNHLVNFGKATCLIQAGGYKGTGFHFGGGWVMSVAHNFQDNQDPDWYHSPLKRATFTFTINDKKFVFSHSENASRMAFVHHLKAGDDIDLENKDIAMVKLGIQYEYGGRKCEDWESAERDKLNEMGSRYGFADIQAKREVKVDEKVVAIHYGGDDNIKIENLTVKSGQQNPIIILHPAIKPGASGCPILNKDYKLVGVFVGGDEAEGVALMWDGGIQKYISSGVQIILHAESYLAQKNFHYTNERINSKIQEQASQDKLEKMAKESQLTIYLMNGETFYGQN
jgi:hypothetical protein